MEINMLPGFLAYPGRTYRAPLPQRSRPASSCNIPSCLSLNTTADKTQYIDEVALKFPSLSIICGHIGYPWTQEMIGVAWKHANVYIDTSAYLPKYYPPVKAPRLRRLPANSADTRLLRN
jgi:hypothetical protein